MRKLITLNIFLSVILFAISVRYIQYAGQAETDYYRLITSDTIEHISPRCIACENASVTIGYISLVLFLAFIVSFSWLMSGYRAIRVLIIMNIMLSIGMVFWDIEMIVNAKTISFAETGLIWIAYACVQLAFTSVLFIYSTPQKKWNHAMDKMEKYANN